MGTYIDQLYALVLMFMALSLNVIIYPWTVGFINTNMTGLVAIISYASLYLWILTSILFIPAAKALGLQTRISIVTIIAAFALWITALAINMIIYPWADTFILSHLSSKMALPAYTILFLWIIIGMYIGPIIVGLGLAFETPSDDMGR